MSQEVSPYAPPKLPLDRAEKPEKAKPGVVLITLTILAAALNGYLTYIRGAVMYAAEEPGYLEGFVIGSIISPAFIVLIFLIWKRFRNRRSVCLIYFWATIADILVRDLPGAIGS